MAPNLDVILLKNATFRKENSTIARVPKKVFILICETLEIYLVAIERLAFSSRVKSHSHWEIFEILKPEIGVWVKLTHCDYGGLKK